MSSPTSGAAWASSPAPALRAPRTRRGWSLWLSPTSWLWPSRRRTDSAPTWRWLAAVKSEAATVKSQQIDLHEVGSRATTTIPGPRTSSSASTTRPRYEASTTVRQLQVTKADAGLEPEGDGWDGWGDRQDTEDSLQAGDQAEDSSKSLTDILTPNLYLCCPWSNLDM